MCNDSTYDIESAAALLIADLEEFAWIALCNGCDDLAEDINNELIAARADFAELVA